MTAALALKRHASPTGNTASGEGWSLRAGLWRGWGGEVSASVVSLIGNWICQFAGAISLWMVIGIWLCCMLAVFVRTRVHLQKKGQPPSCLFFVFFNFPLHFSLASFVAELPPSPLLPSHAAQGSAVESWKGRKGLHISGNLTVLQQMAVHWRFALPAKQSYFNEGDFMFAVDTLVSVGSWTCTWTLAREHVTPGARTRDLGMVMTWGLGLCVCPVLIF